jgi:glycosyltransferase 2 family protein
MRKIIIAIVLLLAVAFVIFSIAELQNILATLRQSNPRFLFIAILFEIICLFNTATTFGALYRLVGMQETRWRLFLMTTAAAFVNIVAPTAGAGGIAVFIDVARRRKQSTARVMVVGVLYLVYEYAALFCVLTVGFWELLRHNDLTTGEVIAAAFLLIVAIGDGIMLYLGYKSPQSLGRVLAWLSRLGNRLVKPFLHREWLNEQNAYQFSREISKGISAIRASPKNLIWPFLFTLNNKALLLCVLAFCFLALGVPFTPGILVGGFSINFLFSYASPTSSGVGFVEGIMPVALNTMGVPLTQAILTTLVFRGLTVWLPLAVGLVAFRMVQREIKHLPEAPQSTEDTAGKGQAAGE